MIRFTDQTPEHLGEYFQPSSRQTDRMVKGNSTSMFNGWAIDRTEGSKWPFLGEFDDQTWDDFEHNPVDWHIQLGSSFQPAVFKDGIRNPINLYQVEVVIVPICIADGSPCRLKALGYFGYSYARTGPMTMNTVTQFTYNWVLDAFRAASAEWNNQSGNEQLNLGANP